jgi:probable DNA repair protein
MYDWLNDTLDESTCLVTANRRLARELQSAWGAHQVAAGKSAWRTPEIKAWQNWLASLLAAAGNAVSLPTRINMHQSQVLWERCLRKELGDDATGLASLARQARDTWQRLADARVSIREVAASARSQDQRMFAAAAGRYLAVLENENWVDDAGLAAVVLKLVNSRNLPLANRYVFAGFDRERPSLIAIQHALSDAGSEIVIQEQTGQGAKPMVCEYEQRDAELRSAGAWARQLLEAQPDARIAIVMQGLEQSARRDLRLVREGFVPGWQYGPASLRGAVNVSYGKKLSAYPAISIALLALRWLVQDLSSREVARLLQSPMICEGDLAGRSRLELRLRAMPDRAWAPSMVTGALRGNKESADGTDWLARVTALSQGRRQLPKSASPHEWVLIVDESLRALGWPGPGSRSSASFQLINRWRELLNDFARLDLVSARMSASAAISKLEQMAADTVYQPETRNAAVHLMGPLEASGSEVDAIWIAGLTAMNWPPPGNPSALVSRELQKQHSMPDATPDDTRDWAATMLQRLKGSAPLVVCSYALVEDNVDQTESELLGRFELTASPDDPGWHAASLVSRTATTKVTDDVPPLGAEKVYGGAGTVHNQMSEPFTAFAAGRLGARGLDRQALGIPPMLRGNLVHDALYRLYQGYGSARELRQADKVRMSQQIQDAADDALQRHLRHTDPVLQQILNLERDRMVDVITTFVGIDGERGDFDIADLEGSLEFKRDNLRLTLRFDRIDRYADNSIAIIDYKTGAAKQLMLRDGTVKEAQLFVYALATDQPVAMLALANLDPRATGFSGAGRGFTDESAWPDLLASIGTEINSACDSLAAGDVRIIAEQGASDARQLNLLSRYTELRHDD